MGDCECFQFRSVSALFALIEAFIAAAYNLFESFAFCYTKHLLSYYTRVFLPNYLVSKLERQTPTVAHLVGRTLESGGSLLLIKYTRKYL